MCRMGFLRNCTSLNFFFGTQTIRVNHRTLLSQGFLSLKEVIICFRKQNSKLVYFYQIYNFFQIEFNEQKRIQIWCCFDKPKQNCWRMISKLNEFLKTSAVVTYIFCKTTNLCIILKSFTFFHSLNKEMFRNANIFKQRRAIFRVG